MEENNNEKFVPAYNKDDGSRKSSQTRQKNDKKIKSKISKIILFLFVIAIIIAIIFGIYFFVINRGDETAVNYTESMKAYGFDIMYDNKTAEPKETVTKSEAIKMVVVSMLNESNITKIVEMNEYIPDYQNTMTEEQIEQKLEYKNQLWVEYAVSVGIVQKGEITAKNANDTATFLETLVYFSNAKLKILNEILDTESIPDIKDYDMYKMSEQLALSDMIYNGIITGDESELKKDLTKGKLNKLLIDMVLKYNTITVDGEKININKDKEPSNASEYPYTLASVDKSIYELKNYVADETSYKNARDSYVDMKKYYYAINSLVQDYASLVLNVDYATLNETEFTNSLLDLSFHYEDSSNIKEYVDYVKANKIKIIGSAKVQYPAVYFDGDAYRIRVKVDYKIESADKKENVLYGDLRSKNSVTYTKDEDSIIVDIPVRKSRINDLMYVELRALSNIKAGSVKTDEESLKHEENNQATTEENIDNGTYVPKSEDIEYTESEIIQEDGVLVIKPK